MVIRHGMRGSIPLLFKKVGEDDRLFHWVEGVEEGKGNEYRGQEKEAVEGGTGERSGTWLLIVTPVSPLLPAVCSNLTCVFLVPPPNGIS